MDAYSSSPLLPKSITSTGGTTFDYTLLNEEEDEEKVAKQGQQQQQNQFHNVGSPYMTTITESTATTKETTNPSVETAINDTSTAAEPSPANPTSAVIFESCVSDGCAALLPFISHSTKSSGDNATGVSVSSISKSATTTTKVIPQQVDLESMGQGSMYEMKLSDYQEILQLPGNRVCVDCGVDTSDSDHDNDSSSLQRIASSSPSGTPDWGSPNLGVLFCFACSGIHRSLGTHISFVRSVRMDAWDEKKQIPLMRLGGNQRCNSFLKKHNITTHLSINKKSVSDAEYDAQLRIMIRQKYDNPVAQYYQQLLKAERDGIPVPSIPESVQNYKPLDAGLETTLSSTTTTPTKKKVMEGFGSPSTVSYRNYNQNVTDNRSSETVTNGTKRPKVMIIVVIATVVVVVGVVIAILFFR